MKRIDWPAKPRLEVRDLRLVLALDSAGTTARAAELLHLSQPAASRALVTLEGRLATRLFDRTPRGLSPTAAGRRLIDQAARLLNELSDLEQQIALPPSAAKIRLVCECYTAYHWLPSALVELRASMPGLDVSLAVEHTRAPFAALETGELDAALVTSPSAPRGRFDQSELFSDEVVFVMSEQHPLARKDALTRADLRSNTLLSSQSAPAEVQWFMAKAFGKARPKLQFERFPVTEAIIDSARAGLGIAVLSEWIASPHLARGELVAKRLVNGPLTRPWRLVYRRELGVSGERLAMALANLAPRSRLVS